MLHRLLVFLFLVTLFHASVYFTFFKRDAAARAINGYKKAETPQMAADQFKIALGKRDFIYAADYCTGPYAEQLKRAEKGAKKLGTAIDEFLYQLGERKLVRDELTLMLYLLDPFPKDINILVGKASADSAEAVITFVPPKFEGGQPSTVNEWNITKDMLRVFIQTLPASGPGNSVVVVPMKKEKGEWKFDFPVDSTLIARVNLFNEKHMNFVNALDTIKQEIKNDDTTKENVTKRLREILEQASRE